MDTACTYLSSGAGGDGIWGTYKRLWKTWSNKDPRPSPGIVSVDASGIPFICVSALAALLQVKF